MHTARSTISLVGALAFGLATSFGPMAHAGPSSATSTGSTTITPVTVTFHDPHKFIESLQSGPGRGFDHDGYLEKLKADIIKKATPMLAPGQHLAITFTNIDLAGGYEPWRGPRLANVRFMTDAFPPRFDFTFKLTSAHGKVIREGTRKLIGLGYLHDFPAMPGQSDPLYYDKGVINQWLRRGPAKW
ncbi:MAG TPA: DUF3016 domain-containing protein [Rhodanobacteraceae bacterium]